MKQQREGEREGQPTTSRSAQMIMTDYGYLLALVYYTIACTMDYKYYVTGMENSNAIKTRYDVTFNSFME